MLPRVSGLLSSGDHKAVNKMHELSFLIYNLVIFPIIAGLLIVNKDFVSFFLGKISKRLILLLLLWSLGCSLLVGQILWESRF